MASRTLVAGGEGGADALAHAAAFEFEAEFEVEELFEDEALVRGRGGGHELDHGGAGFGEVDGAEGFEAGGEVEAGEHCGGGFRWRAELVDPTHDGEAVMDGAPGSYPDSASSSKMVQTMRRIHLEVSLAPQGVVPPSDS